MDLLTQGFLAGVAAQSVRASKVPKLDVKKLSWAAFFAGCLPDADLFIYSSLRPVTTYIYHRHFSHSLFFVPFGALLIALIFYYLYKKSVNFKELYIFSFLGILTHGLLDCNTSYGTQLWWPFSNIRISWDSIAIIDLFYSAPLVLAFYWGLKGKKFKGIQAIFLYTFCYLAFGFYQNSLVIKAQDKLVALRGDQKIKGRAIPSILHLFTFRSIYQTEKSIQVDAITVYPFSSNFFYWEGERVDKLDVNKLLIEASTPKRNGDLKVLDWFSDTYMTGQACIREDKAAFCLYDIRYGQPITSAKGMWGSYYLLNEDSYIKKIPGEPLKRLTRLGGIFEMIAGTYPNKKVGNF